MTPDVIVIGSGMSGAPAAWLLSERGHNVLLIESGADISPAELPTASIDWERKRDSEFNPVASKRKNLGDYPVDDAKSPIAVCNFNAVGGSSILYSAHFPRFLRPDFRLTTEEGLGADWPISYDELLPFFEMNERIVGLAGKVGDTFYPELQQVFNSPVPLGVAGESLAGGFDELGWHWWPSYAAINTDRNIRHRLKCHGLGPCNTGCPMGAKATAKNTYLNLGLAKRVTLMSEATVSKLLIHESRIMGVELIDRDKQVHKILCDKVVLAAGAIGTPRILLNSLDEYNAQKVLRKDLIGKNLMMHPLGYAEGYFSDKIDTEKGPQGAMLYSLEFYRPPEPVDFKLGFMMHALRGDSPVGTVQGLYSRRKLKFGADIYQQFTENYGHTIGIAIICEDLPDETNKVELDHDNLDHLGVPGVKVSYELSKNSKRMMSYGLKKARQVLASAGAKKTSGFGPIRNTGWHLFGTTCMGEDPQASVVDSNGALHGLPGVYVFDASVFVTSSCVNPANTIQALSLYLSDRLDEHIRNGH
ncbi:MAG: GMC family oxidoreductase [Sedimenticola sp.]